MTDEIILWIGRIAAAMGTINLLARAIPAAQFGWLELNVPRVAAVLRVCRAFGVDAIKAGKTLATGVVLGRVTPEAVAHFTVAGQALVEAAKAKPPAPIDPKDGAA